MGLDIERGLFHKETIAQKRYNKYKLLTFRKSKSLEQLSADLQKVCVSQKPTKIQAC